MRLFEIIKHIVLLVGVSITFSTYIEAEEPRVR